MSSVNIIKLTTGEELIAELVSIDETTKVHALRNPLAIAPTDKGSYVMIPFLPLSKNDTINIKECHILACEVVAEQTANQYLRNFSDLYVPPTPSTKIIF
jgi:small nuclear ribonucleoprotein (snRNP)-like protein